jgi:hypothetical protein
MTVIIPAIVMNIPSSVTNDFLDVKGTISVSGTP